MNLLLACDVEYYNQWAINCIKSVKQNAPWLKIHVVIVNPTDQIEKFDDVIYHYDYKEFNNDNSKVAYFQAVRFLKCPEIFPNKELVLSIDCDTILTKPISIKEYRRLAKDISVLKHHKEDRYMAGFITFGGHTKFRKRFKELLLSSPIDEWIYGWDQTVLNMLRNEFDFKTIKVGTWMSFGKGKGLFLTLKGDQKVTQKYIDNYENLMNDIC